MSIVLVTFFHIRKRDPDNVAYIFDVCVQHKTEFK